MSLAAPAPALADVLPHLPDPALLLAPNGQCLGASRTAQLLLGGALLGRSLADILGIALTEELDEQLALASAGQESMLPSLVERQSLVFDVHFVPAGGQVLVLLRRAETARGLDQLRELLARAADGPAALPEMLDRFCRWVEHNQPGILCSILLYDADAGVLRHGGAPSLPAAYNRWVDGTAVGPNQGSCGTAVHRGEAVVVVDIATDPLWRDLREAPRAAGLAACWSLPIRMDGGAVLGSFAVYRRVPGAPSPREQAFITDACNLVALVIDRVRQREALKRYAAQLEESEASYRLIVEEHSDVILLLDAAGAVTYASPSITPMLGCLPSEFVAQGIAPYVHPDDLSLTRARIAARFAGEAQLESITLRLLRTDGALRHVDVRGRLLQATAERPARLLVCLRDITERLAHEQALRQSERRLRQLFDNLNGLLFLLDPEGRIVEISETAARVGGFLKRDVIGRELWTIAPITSVDETARHLQDSVRAAQSGRAAGGEVSFRAAGDEVRLARYRVTPLADEQGAVTFILGEAIDITEQRRAERSLAESERLFKGISDQSPLLVGLFDMEDSSFLYLSTAFERMLGRLPAEVIGSGPEGLLDLFAAEDMPLVDAAIAEAVIAPDDHVIEAELRWRHADGSLRRLVSRTVVFSRTAGGGAKLLLMVADDVTDRRALEARLRQSDKMEALGTLAGGVAHDFNNLLAVIMSHGELLAGDLPPGSATLDDVGQILAASRRAKDLVRQILAFSRQSELSHDAFDLGTVIRETLRFLRASLPATIEFRSQLPAEPMLVQGDANQVQQVLINLGVNAEYAMRTTGGGTLEVAVDTVHVAANADDELPSGRYHRLRFRDTGRGMSSTVLRRAFEPFYTTKPVGEGTGMGLAAAHGIVSQHGGRMRVSSVEGEGTTFEVLLPDAGRAASIDPVAAAETATVTLRGRVLLVDDEPAIVRVMTKVLTRLGFEPTATTDPEEALALVRADPERFDCVVTDLTMPRLSGEQLAREILRIRQTMPIVLCTGYSHDVTAASAAALGIAAFLTKPIEPAELVDALARVLAAPR